ncbi:MAG: SDR family oxidoreductase [Bacteroidales bacterium]|nr:SDR family oxidoreductase [Bacteroidales bacterium]
MNNPFTLSGKTILVTGASAGIGRGIAVACAGMGAQVILTARNTERLQETLSQLEGDGHSYIAADLTNEAERRVLVEQLPMLDGVVQCAGVGNRVPCKMLMQEDLDRVMKPNTEAPMLLQSLLLSEKKLKKQASVVFIASAAATMPVAGNAVYSASKAALVAYAKCLAQELASRQIRVNCISPAMVWTNLIKEDLSMEQLKRAESTYPLGRFGKSEDIAYLSIYLLSNASEWMTGNDIEITGGSLIG